MLKKLIIIFCIIAFALSTYFLINYVNSEKKSSAKISSRDSQSEINKNSKLNKDDSGKPFIINSEPDYLKGYFTFEDFIKDSQYIIKAEVVDTKILNEENSLFTIANVQVQKSYFGNIKKDQLIELVFNEATLDGEAAKEYLRTIYQNKFGKTPDKDLPKQIIYSIDGQENFKVGDSLLLFLIDKPENVYGISNYNVVGAAQGRFLWRGNKVEIHHILNQSSIENILSRDKSAIDGDKLDKKLTELLK